MSAKSAKKYRCELCDYTARYPKDLMKHKTTRKHKMISGETIADTINAPSKKYICNKCGVEYKYASGLSRHKATCEISLEIASKPEEKLESKSEDNSEVKNESAEIKKLTQQVGILTTALTTALTEGKLGNTTNNNNTTNNQFNLNIFLNEKCKDAMNITDFVDQIKLQLSDLETQGKMGYVDGISNIFIKNLDEMDEDKRPIHCTDTKREVLYVKNNDTWEKGDIGRDEMKKAIDKISKNNIQQFGKWINENPQCKVAHTPKADQFHEISSELNGCSQEKNIDKVIRKIAKSTTIEKK